MFGAECWHFHASLNKVPEAAISILSWCLSQAAEGKQVNLTFADSVNSLEVLHDPALLLMKQVGF